MDVDKVISDILITDKREREKVDALKEKLSQLNQNALEKKDEYLKDFRAVWEERYQTQKAQGDQEVERYRNEELDKTKTQRMDLEERFKLNKDEWVQQLFTKVTS